MEDRKLHDKIRARRKRRIKKRKANKFKVILLILAAIVFVFLFYKIMYRRRLWKKMFQKKSLK